MHCNCKIVRSSVEETQTLCEKCDSVILQDTWLRDADIPFLATIASRFYCKGISSSVGMRTYTKVAPMVDSVFYGENYIVILLCICI